MSAWTLWVGRHPLIVLAGSLLAVAASIWLSCCRLEYHTQRDDLMSADKACQVRWRNYLTEFGSDDDIVFVVEGGTEKRMQAAIDSLALSLRSHPEHFDRVFEKVDLRPLRNRALLYLSSEELDQLYLHLRQLGPLLGSFSSFVWYEMNLRNMVVRLDAILTDSAQGVPLSESDSAFIKQFSMIARSASAALEHPEPFLDPWTSLMQGDAQREDQLASPRYFTSDDRSLHFMVARPANPDRNSFTPVAQAVVQARTIVEATRHQYPDLQFGLTGLPVLEHDEMAGTDRDSTRATWLALAGVALLYLVVYRGFRYPLLTVGSLITGTVWSLGLTAVAVGHLNILTSAFAVMLIGMGDYGVLWIARFDEVRRSGHGFASALAHTGAHAGPSILIAALTTSLAFFATMLADFKAVTELGFIAGSGVLLCALASLLVIPALLAIRHGFWKRQRHPSLLEFPQGLSANRPWLPALAQRPKMVVIVSVGLFIFGIMAGSGMNYDHNLLHLQATDLESVQWEYRLIERTHGAGWSALSLANSPQEARALRARYEQLPSVARAEEIASLIPEKQEEKIAIIQKIANLMHHLPQRDQVALHALPDLGSLRQSIAQLERHASEKITDPELMRSIQTLHTQVQKSTVYPRNLAAFETSLTLSLWDKIQPLQDVATPAAITLNDLPTNLRERFISPSGKWLVRAYAGEDVWMNDALARFVSQARTVDLEATGKPFGTLEGLRAMRSGFEWAGVYALVAITAILFLDLRSIRYVLLGLAPLALGLAMTLACMRLLGVSFNPANIIAFPLIVGVGVDNGVHILHDFLAHPSHSDYQMSAATGRGIFVAALTTILGFGTLMISQHRGMHSLGLALSLGVSCCTFSSLVVLPSLLKILRQRPQICQSRDKLAA